MTGKTKKIILISANAVLIALIIFHPFNKRLIIPFFLFSTLFFLNTVLYIQFYLFEHLVWKRFQRKLLGVLMVVIIAILLILYQRSQ